MVIGKGWLISFDPAVLQLFIFYHNLPQDWHTPDNDTGFFIPVSLKKNPPGRSLSQRRQIKVFKLAAGPIPSHKSFTNPKSLHLLPLKVIVT